MSLLRSYVVFIVSLMLMGTMLFSSAQANPESGVAPVVIKQTMDEYSLPDAVSRQIVATINGSRIPLLKQNAAYRHLAMEYSVLQGVLADMKGGQSADIQKLFEQGQFKQAQQALQPLAGVAEPKDASYHALSLAYELIGQRKTAKDAIDKAISLNPNDANYLAQAGHLDFMQRQYPQAADYLKKAVKAAQASGENNKQLAKRYLNLGVALYAQAYGKEALADLGQSLTLAESAEAHSHIGTVYKDLGDIQNALRHYQAAHDAYQKQFGAKNPFVTDQLYKLGMAWRIDRQQQKAIDLYEQALKTDKEIYGADHPIIATRLNEYGAMMRLLGDSDKAMQLYQQALDIDSTHKTPFTDTALIRDYNSLGLTEDSKKNPASAVAYFDKAIEVKKRLYGEEHPMMALSYGNIGKAWLDGEKPEKAMIAYEKALEITRKAYGSKHTEVASLLRNIGIAWQTKGDYEKAASYYRQALEIDKEVYGPDHPMVTRLMDLLGVALNELGRSDEAEAYHRSALQIDRQAYGETHSNVARDLSHLGTAKNKQGDLEGAAKYHKEAVEVGRMVYGGSHENVSDDLKSLGADLKGMGETKASVEYREQAVDIDKRNRGENDHNVAIEENNIGVDLYDLGEDKGAEDYIKEAATTMEPEAVEGDNDAKKVIRNYEVLEEDLKAQGKR